LSNGVTHFCSGGGYVYSALRTPRPPRRAVPVTVSRPRSPPPELVERAREAAEWAAAHPRPAAVGACLLAVLAGGGVLACALAARWRHARLARHAHLVALAPPPGVDPAALGRGACWPRPVLDCPSHRPHTTRPPPEARSGRPRTPACAGRLMRGIVERRGAVVAGALIVSAALCLLLTGLLLTGCGHRSKAAVREEDH